MAAATGSTAPLMTAKGLLLPLLCVFTPFLYATNVASQPDCATVKYIETLNGSALEKRVAHIKGRNAIAFIALDPIFSESEFGDVAHRYHPEDLKKIKRDFVHLTEQGIDEVVVWKFRRPAALGVAVAFKAGCAVSGYGEPDLLDKLIAMHKTFLLISEHGIDHPSVRDSIKKILVLSNYFPDEDKIDKMINKVRPLIASDTS
jgi:hypothetical protein